MKIVKRTLLVLFILLLAAAAAIYFWRVEIREHVLPSVEDVTVEKVSIHNNKAHISMFLTVTNPDMADFELDKVVMEVLNDTLHLMRYENDSALAIKRGETRTFPFEFDLPMKPLMKRIRSLQDQDSTDLRVIGSMIVKTNFGDFRLPIDRIIDVPVPTPPKVTVHSIEYLGHENENYDFIINLSLEIKNENITALRDVTYDFQGSDFLESKGTYDKDVVPDGSGRAEVHLPVRVAAVNRLKILSKVLTNNDIIDYKLVMTGTVITKNDDISEVPLSFMKEGQVELYNKERKGKVPITKRK
jgi:LEA14-like dessication related protein